MKTNLDSAFKTVENLEKKGIWFTISDKTGFLVSRYNENNPQAKRAHAMYFKPYARQIDMGTMESSKEQELMIKLFVNSCMMDWKGVEIDGKETPFDKEIAVKFFLHLPELFKSLFNYASDFKNFKEDYVEGEDEESKSDLGNS